MQRLSVTFSLTACCAILLSWSQFMQASTYYLSAEGSDLHNGRSPSQAWASLAQVNNFSFQPGDTILLEGGTSFAGSLSFGPGQGGSALAPLVIASYGEGKATISAGGGHGISIYNCAGLVIRSLLLKGSGMENNEEGGILAFHDKTIQGFLTNLQLIDLEIEGFRFGIGIGGQLEEGGFEDVEISHCHVHHVRENGIFSWAEDQGASPMLAHRRWRIRHCLVEQIPGKPDPNQHSGNGIMISSVDTCLIEFNLARYCGQHNLHCGGPVGIWAYAASHVVIQHNEAHHISHGTGCDGGGFDLDGGCTHSIMQYNYSHHNAGAGYLIAQYADAPPIHHLTIRYNLSEHDGSQGKYGGIVLWTSRQGPHPQIQDVDIYHNTIFTEASPSSPALAIWDNDYARVRIFHNLFLTGSSPVMVDEALAGVRFLRNLYYCYQGPVRIQAQGTLYSSMAAWAQATGAEMQDQQISGLAVDPLLVAPGTAGTLDDPMLLNSILAYQLAGSSPAIGQGIVLASEGIDPSTKDFWGTPLPEHSHDLGAYQSPSENSTDVATLLRSMFSIRIAPNPAQDSLVLHLSGTSPWKEAQFSIWNVHGQLVHAGAVWPSQAIIPIHALTNGQYFLNIQLGGQSLPSQSFIIAR